jgi:hypothetical protein
MHVLTLKSINTSPCAVVHNEVAAKQVFVVRKD